MPWRRGFQLALQGTVFFGLATLCLLVLAWLTLQWGILPHIEDWRPAIERHASKAVGVPVRIGHIAVRSSGWVPALELRDVVLLDPAGPEALRLPRVSAALSPRSLLVMEPRLSQLYIEDAHLLVRRDAQGGIHVAGIDVPTTTSASTAVDQTPALDWFFSQEEFVLRHGNVRWLDEQRQAPPLELADVDLVVRNSLRTHAMRLDATPPAEWGKRFSLRADARQPLFANAGDWRRWTGTFYADLPRGDVAQLKEYVDLPFELDGGEGALRLWLDFQTNGWRGATADVRLQGVGMRLGPGLEPLAIAQASGRLSAERTTAGVAFGAEGFGFETADGIVWPRGNLQLGWYQRQTLLKPAQAMPVRSGWGSASGVVGPSSGAPTMLWDTDQPVTGGRVSADALDLTLMRHLAGSLPLPQGAQQWLADFRPAGVVKGLALRWDGPIESPTHYRATAAVDGFSMAAGALPADDSIGRPGWRNASLRFDANETGGTAHVALDDGAIELPGVFDEPVIPFDRLAASASWTISSPRDRSQPAALSLALHDVRFSNADAEGVLQLDWRAGPVGVPSAPAAASAPAAGHGRRFPGHLDLKGELTRGRASEVARYLPRSIPEGTRRYLHDAFPTGDLDNVHFAVRGDLADFPYVRREGEFRIAGHVSNATMNYVPGPAPADGSAAPALWPVFTQVSGEIVLDHGGLEIRNAAARVGEVALRDVHGGFRSLYDQQTLALQGRAAGPMTDFLRYVAQSPIGGWLGNGLASTTATGNGELSLALAIPLAHTEKATVDGSLLLSGNDVRLMPEVPVLANARARIDFTQRGVTVSGGAARALGGDLVFDGGTQPDGALRFVAQGSASADGLRRAVDEPAIARLAGHLNGQTSYRLQIGILKGQTEFALSSPMTGLGIALPAPLDKPAEASWPLKVSTTLSFDVQGRPRDTVRVEFGNPANPVLQAEVLRDLSPPSPRPIRSAYAVGAPLPPPQADGIAVVHAAAINADAWWSLLRSLRPDGAPSATPPGSGANASTPAWWPATASLTAQDLRVGGHHLTAVDMQLAQTIADTTEGWRLSITSDQTHGIIEYRPDSAAHGAQVFARLDRLALDSRESGSGDGATGSSQASARQQGSVPALDIVVDSFELNAKKLGKLEVSATSQAGGRDWRLTRLALTTPEARFTGTGQWSGAPLSRAALDFKLDLSDSGAFLERLGLGRVLKGGKGELSGAVTWTGSPLALDYPSLAGKLQVALDQGQFLKADAGAARLLGVLSLQALPRRLTLDFRDLFQEGFAFDNVTGDVQIERGVASTNNLRMRGVSAVVLMEGSADLQAETQDLRVVVVPEINAGAAALAYAAINPVIGLGTFLAQLFLRHPLMQANTKEFHIAGSWADPKVEEVPHRTAAAAASAPAATASGPASSPAATASASGAVTVSR